MIKYRLRIKSFNNKIFLYTIKYLNNLLKLKNILYKIIILPKLIKKFCVLSSPHIDKNAREQFEICFYKAFIDIKIDDIKVLDFFFNIELPSGILITFHIIK